MDPYHHSSFHKRNGFNFPPENNFHERWARSIKVPLSTEGSGESENLASSTYLDSVIRVRSVEHSNETHLLFPFSRKNSSISILEGLLFRREFWILLIKQAFAPIYYFHYRNFDVMIIHKVKTRVSKYYYLYRYIVCITNNRFIFTNDLVNVNNRKWFYIWFFYSPRHFLLNFIECTSIDTN